MAHIQNTRNCAQYVLFDAKKIQHIQSEIIKQNETVECQQNEQKGEVIITITIK